MRPNIQRAGAAAGALTVVATCAAYVPAAVQAEAQGTAPTMRVADRSVTAGHRVHVSGKAVQNYTRTLALQFRPVGGGAWRTIGTTKVGRGDRFEISRPLVRSGRLRTVVLPRNGSATASSSPYSAETAVTVARRVVVGARRLHVTVGRRTGVAGRVRPAIAGLPVALQVRTGGRWKTLDRARTRGAGRYRLRGKVVATGDAQARVVTSRAAGLAGGVHRVGRVHGYRYAQASWYGPGLYGGHLACGGTLGPGTLGVAHKSLPCGSRVTFRHGGRSVTVRVIDRGPYVGGREYDLTAATAQRLGFRGHGPVLATR